jgi:glycosyltransferase involved in cell wall biosynthesis
MSAASLSLTLVIPTRDEAGNVEALLAGICEAVPGSQKELIFVDDSEDETPHLLRRLLAHADCPARVIHRERPERRGGLSTAVVFGCGLAEGRWICIMDADLQHPASAIPLLVEAAAASDADIVVGSRYMPHQDAPDGFDGLSRRLVSAAGRAVARALIPSSRATTDPLSGFFLFRRSILDGVTLRPIGYKVLLEILVRGRWRHVVDVPYLFHSRNAGVSKATFRQGMQFVRHLALLALAPEPSRRGARRPPAETEAIPPHLLRAEGSSELMESPGEAKGAAHAER